MKYNSIIYLNVKNKFNEKKQRPKKSTIRIYKHMLIMFIIDPFFTKK